LLKVGVSNGAISLQYIHSRADLSVQITFSEVSLLDRTERALVAPDVKAKERPQSVG